MPIADWSLQGFARGQSLILTVGRSREEVYRLAPQALRDSGYRLAEVEPICVYRWGRESWVYCEDLDLRKAKIFRGRF